MYFKFLNFIVIIPLSIFLIKCIEIKYKNKIFIVSDIGEQKILEIDNEEKTSLIIYNLETYNFDKAEGISVYEKSRIIVDAKNKSVEISYPSGSVWKYSCSKLK